MSDAQHSMMPAARGFLGRLSRDRRGNTMAIMAMALIPLAGMVGGGVDISRMYIVKTRLQHACDAGALAGRKAMGGGTWSQSNYAPRTSAENFFDANYQSDAYGATDRQRTFTEAAGKVTGTASAVLPMTLMKIFGRTTETLSVTCDAEMRLPNTDVMFVLDTTGSMDDKAVSTDSVDKITALKTAVKCFYEIVARLNTAETCTGGDPSGGTGDQVQIRFGFMPYATNVNVGKLLPTSYFANSWNYQSREPTYTTTTSSPAMGTFTPSGSASNGSWSDKAYYFSSNSSSNCVALPNSPYTQSGTIGSPTNSNSTVSGDVTTTTYNASTGGWYYQYQYDSYDSWNDRCYYDRRTVTYNSGTGAFTRTTTRSFDKYRYAKLSKDISGLKNGTTWNSSFQSNVGTEGAMKTINWGGCIEERQTKVTSTFSPIPSDAYDLNIDLVPSQGTASSLWGPVLPDMIYTRDITYSGGWGGGYSGSFDNSETTTDTEYVNYSSYACPQEARKLQSWTTASTFESYVNSLSPSGNTYHDIGLLWGARFMSPTGIFASENAYTPQGGEIERHMIFMTDGDTNASNTDYAAYGIPWFDRRQTVSTSAPSNTTLNDQINARFLALCTAVKNQNITLWVISFGSGSNSTTEDRLESCATSGRYFVARDSATLQTTFRSIADQISQLRLTR
ncbi:MAG: pilus assembly protein [Pseudomonadota bacterium]